MSFKDSISNTRKTHPAIPAGRKALFNTLRMHWLRDNHIPVESWQVENYREMSSEQLFSSLEANEVALDRISLLALAEEMESPEEMTEMLLQGTQVDPHIEDQVFLVVFELWRRFVSQKQTLSIFCDELDYQIDLYERGEGNPEAIEDVLANLAVILEENCDQGMTPEEVFSSISSICAHDLESFLYDFIADQIDNKNGIYAQELLEDFMPYFEDKKWFELLHAKLILLSNTIEGNELFKKIHKVYKNDPNLEFHLESLAFMIPGGNKTVFQEILAETFPFIAKEEEFLDLLSICLDYLHYSDDEKGENFLNKLILDRSKHNPKQLFSPKDSSIKAVLNLFTF